MDALDLLEQQHRDIASLIDHLAEETSPGQRTALARRVVRAIEAHSRAEERCFYPTFRARIGDGGRLYEVFEHHALLRFAAVNLLRTRATDLRFDARLEMMRELALRHAEAEEDWAFPKAKRNLLDEDLDQIGVQVAHTHDVLMTSTGAPASTWDRKPRRASSAFAGGSRRRADPEAPSDLTTAARLERIDVAARPLPVRRAHRETARPIPRASQRRVSRSPS
jgi:hemerythrin superfamily protein